YGGFAPEGVYFAAGWAKDGVAERIQKEMGRRFPNVAVGDLTVTPDGAVAYSYLRAGVKFGRPYPESDEPLKFKSSLGVETPVRAFGLRQSDRGKQHTVREQVKLLYFAREDGGLRSYKFVMDLDQYSRPNQIFVARLPRKETLAEMVADLA